MLVQHSWGAVLSSGQAWVGVLVQPDQLALLRLPDPLDQASLHECPNPLTEQQFVCLFYGESISFLPTKILYAAENFNPSTLV